MRSWAGMSSTLSRHPRADGPRRYAEADAPRQWRNSPRSGKVRVPTQSVGTRGEFVARSGLHP
ncbi:hypothetical protein [Bythopirellula goksoeyrii]|uniref:hypothetical protein n=1 Tax=Bythopirellula goksoeyrii TaxID=1400387 RepID=UPI00143DFCD8|nr:hypothetical protein [Bythopirellula goksoeyrii]